MYKLTCSYQQPCEIGTILKCILQMRKQYTVTITTTTRTVAMNRLLLLLLLMSVCYVSVSWLWSLVTLWMGGVHTVLSSTICSVPVGSRLWASFMESIHPIFGFPPFLPPSNFSQHYCVFQKTLHKIIEINNLPEIDGIPIQLFQGTHTC